IQLAEAHLLKLFNGDQIALNVPSPDHAQPWQVDFLRADFISLPENLRAEAMRRQEYLDEILKVNPVGPRQAVRSEEHTSELQSLMRNSYAVFCLKKKKH